jgi:hypothetical protein
MGRQRSALLGLACGLLLVAGCTYTAFPAEWTAAACLNDEDDDGDNKYDCDDPDCWGFAHCQPGDDGAMGAPTMPPELPPMTDDPLVPPGKDPPVTDASMVDMRPPDGHVPPDGPEDASVDAELPPVVCSQYCPVGQCDDDGSCKEPLVFGSYNVESIMLSVPAMSRGICFDDRFECRLQLGCCDPDPIVAIHVAEVKAGFKVVSNVRETTVEDVNMQLELREGDLVRFTVQEEDTPEVGDDEDSPMPQDMFECSTVVTEAMIDAGRVGCVPDSEGPYVFPAGEYYVVAAISRLGDIDDGDEEEDHPGDMP